MNAPLLRLTLAALPVSWCASPVVAETALFDGLSEGAIGSTYTEDGILFSELDRYLGGGNETFVAEDASADLGGFAGFSTPNALAFGGFSPGPNAAYSRCGTFKITPPAVRDFAQLELFLTGTGTGNTVTLEASLGSVVVATDAIVIPSGFGPHAFTLTVSGAFDLLRLVGAGSANSGAFFALVDGVHVELQGIGTTYCTALPNSSALPALMSASGSTSVAANDLVLRAAPLPDQPGLFYYGPMQIFVPFGNGFRCVGGTVGRLPITVATNGELVHALDNTAPPNGSVVITSGSTWNFQAWFRDPPAGGAAFNLSDGLEVSFVP